MEGDRRRQTSQLYHAALLKAVPDRAAFVRDACGGDDVLQREVESLLALDGSAQDFLNTPAAGAAARLMAEGRQTLMIGRQLGAYRVVSLLGVGGMGEVYRARDTKLGRDVAIKILPSVFVTEPQRLARFEREARVLASLNHPRIGAIYGLEEVDGTPALVLEFVDGLTLADRITKGPLPVREALAIAVQIADALDAAHERGIVHRDLKPANVKITPDGVVKVLDFGLAKLNVADGSGSELTQSAKGDVGGTREGTVLGTAAYMSPEQARGLAVDKRTDIWAFGCVLFEMLVGRPAFAAPTVTDTLAAIIEREPDWEALPPIPPRVSHLLRRCLQKDVKQRLRDIGDSKSDLDDEAGRAETSVRTAGASRHRSAVIASSVAGIAVVALLASLIVARFTTTPAPVVRLSIPSLAPPYLPPNGVRHLAISEDGSRVAYTSANQLWIRRMDQQEPIVIDVDATNPFFSPDGEWVGFFGQTELKKVPTLGGTPVPIVTTPDRPGGGTWRADGTIVFATSEGLYQVLEKGGEPRLLVKPDRLRKERAYAWPQFMPDGRSVLFTIVPEDSIDGAQIAVLDMNTLEASIVLKGGSAARYAPTGHLIYASGQTLKAVAFDADTQQTRGDPVSLPDIEVATTLDNGAAEFATSETGTLLFITPNVPGQLLRTLSWVDRQGNEEPLALASGRYAYALISPDGTRVALDIPGANRDIWIWNLQRKNLTKLTGGPTEDMLPVWSPDGRRVFFTSDRTGTFDVYSQAADGATEERVEFAGAGAEFPESFTPDRTQLIVQKDFKDIGILNLARPDRLAPLLHSEFDERLGEVSPDGNWIAYESNESGDRVEIFLRPFPNVSGRREKVSIDGGRFPLWGPKGSGELFYVDLNGGMMAASVQLSPSLILGRVTKLFDWEKPPRGVSGRRYDISPVDGRFLMTKSATAGSNGTIDISVVLNWFGELRERVPLKGR